MRRIGSTVVVLAFLLAGATRLYADSITIGSGSLDIDSVSLLSLNGTGGFTLTAFPDLSIGTIGPLFCGPLPCRPGEPISLAAAWSGGDLLSQVVTFQGVTYKGVGSASSEATSSVAFAGTAIAPPFTGATSATVEAPFTFSGQFSTGSPQFQNAALTGHGTATLQLTLDTSFGGVSWSTKEAHYALTPEPSSVVLMATGLVGLLFLGRRRLFARIATA